MNYPSGKVVSAFKNLLNNFFMLIILHLPYCSSKSEKWSLSILRFSVSSAVLLDFSMFSRDKSYLNLTNRADGEAGAAAAIRGTGIGIFPAFTVNCLDGTGFFT